MAEQKPEKLERACVRWHGRLETEATFLFVGGVAVRARRVGALCGERDAVEVLRRLLRRAGPTRLPPY